MCIRDSLCEGQTLLQRLKGLGTLCAATLEVKDDVVPGKGAPGGVVTALLQASTDFVLLVCCDMPRVDAAALERLVTEEALAGFEVDGRIEPFPGLYPRALGPLWRERLASNPSMTALLAESRCRAVPLSQIDRRVVRSVNTSDDARELGVDIP